MSPADTLIDVGRRNAMRTQYLRRNGVLLVDLRYWLARRAEDGSDYLAPTKRGIQIPAAHITAVIEALTRIQAQMEREGALELVEGRPPRFRPDVYSQDF